MTNQPPTGRVPDLFREGDVLNFRVESGKPYLSLAEQNPVEAALLCIDKTSGAIKALVGGKDYGQTEFNRAIQARRQPGSSFKPIIYAAALDKGLTPASILMDTPLVFGGSNPWSPQNFDHKFNGPTLLRTGLIQSRNIVSISILQRIGVHYAIRYAQQLGITSPFIPIFPWPWVPPGYPWPKWSRRTTVLTMGGIGCFPFISPKSWIVWTGLFTFTRLKPNRS